MSPINLKSSYSCYVCMDRKQYGSNLIIKGSHRASQIATRQSEMADLARRATSVCTKFHRDRLRND